jgi:hypothetical protein
VENDMLRVKICRIPVVSSSIMPGKTVTTIEEIISEINTILTTLKQN